MNRQEFDNTELGKLFNSQTWTRGCRLTEPARLYFERHYSQQPDVAWLLAACVDMRRRMDSFGISSQKDDD